MFKFYRVKALKPNRHSVQARLPQVYKHYVDSLKKTPSAVHYIPETNKYGMNPITNERFRIENRPIPLVFPKEADEGIWGGEGVIKGFVKEKPRRRKFPNYWVPKLKKAVVYSEILNSHMELTVTERTLRLIDQYCGFDHYILGAPVQDLQSQLALSIRRKLLLALINQENHYPDEATNKDVHEKYQKYIIPKEEAEWFGLTLREAVQKQRLLEEEREYVPLKHQFRAKYLEELKNPTKPDESGEAAVEIESGPRAWVSKLNPFGSRS